MTEEELKAIEFHEEHIGYSEQMAQGHVMMLIAEVRRLQKDNADLDHVYEQGCTAIGMLQEDIERLLRVARAAKSLDSNPHIELGDLVYKVREAEGEGWEGENVKDWGNAAYELRKGLEAVKDLLGET